MIDQSISTPPPLLIVIFLQLQSKITDLIEGAILKMGVRVSIPVATPCFARLHISGIISLQTCDSRRELSQMAKLSAI